MLQVAIIAALAWLASRAAFLLPESAVIALFCRIPAFFAAAFHGAALEGHPPFFEVGGITFEVGRSCAGILAFTLLCGFSAPLVSRHRFLWPVWLPGCWVTLLLCNAFRLIAVVPLTLFLADAGLMRFERLMHQTVGSFFFLPLPVYLAWRLQHRGDAGGK